MERWRDEEKGRRREMERKGDKEMNKSDIFVL